MANLSKTIGDTLVTLINSGSFSQAHTAARTFEPEFSKAQDSTAKLEIVPAALETEFEDDTYYQGEYRFLIGFTAPNCKASDTSTIDNHLDYIEELQDFIWSPDNRTLSTGHNLNKQPEVLVYYDFEQLHQSSLFVSIFSATYRADRS